MNEQMDKKKKNTNKNFLPKKQDDLEAFLVFMEKHNNETLKGTVNGMMLIENLTGSFSGKWLKMTFPIQKWQANRVGQLQGGVYSIAIDVAASALARCFNGTDFCPTVDMAVKYYRPMMIGDKMIVKARILRLGKTLTHIFCEVRSQDTGKLVATANTTFLSDSAGNENNSGKTKTDEDRKSTEDTIVFEKSIEHEKDKSVKKTAFSGGYIRNIINNSDKL